jgi:hypothetical protein
MTVVPPYWSSGVQQYFTTKLRRTVYIYIYKMFIAQKVSNIHLFTKYYKIIPLTNLLGLLLAGRVVGGVCLVRLILVQQ